MIKLDYNKKKSIMNKLPKNIKIPLKLSYLSLCFK